MLQFSLKEIITYYRAGCNSWTQFELFCWFEFSAENQQICPCRFLADRSNSRAYDTVLRPSVVVCNV